MVTVAGPLFVTVAETTANNYVGGNQTWAATAYASATDNFTWIWFINGTAQSTVGPGIPNTNSFNTNLSAGGNIVAVTVIDTTTDLIGFAGGTVFINNVFAATVLGTLTASATVSSASATFGGTIIVNEIGHVVAANSFTTYHNGTIIPSFGQQTERSISAAGSFQFQTPKSYGTSINLGDRVEFGYRGNQAFYGWVYSIDKSNEYIYTITAYDGGYGLAQAASNAGNIVTTTASLTVSQVLESFAAQVGGLGSSTTERLGINFVATVIPGIFGWAFSEGQVLQKIESVALGFGYVALIDSFSNIMLDNYQYTTSIGTFSVGTVTIQENVDSFVVQSKMFDPSTEYGAWTVEASNVPSAYATGGSTLIATAGSGKPLRTLGGSWLGAGYVNQLTPQYLGTIAAEYNSIFANGIWTVQMWSNKWFDTSGINLGGSLSAYVGDGQYVFTTVPTVGVVISKTATAAPVATVSVSNVNDLAYVRNSISPQVCIGAGSAIQEIGGFLTSSAAVSGTMGVAGTLTGKSMAFDGMSGLYEVASSVVYLNDWYTSSSSIVGTISGATTILAPAVRTPYIGTSAGVMVPSGGTITGTGSFSVDWMFADTYAGVVYVCTGSTSIPHFPVGGSATTGTLTAAIAATCGCAASDSTANLLLGAGSTVALIHSGSNITTTAVTGTITDISLVNGMAAITADSSGATKVYLYHVTNTSLTATGTIAVSASGGLTARSVMAAVTQQNLYQLNFVDGTTLYNALVSDVQISQTGVLVTFKSGQSSIGAFVGPPDDTQLQMFNITQTTG